MRSVLSVSLLVIAGLLMGLGSQPIEPAKSEGKPVVTPKKGVGHWGRHMPDAPDRLGCSWYYNWRPRPRKEAADTKAEFIPMIWDDYHATDEALADLKSSGYKALLAFNEPDGKGQADMTVAEAIALWPKLEATGLRLGSPGTRTGDPWLDEFMEEARARNFRVDFLCLHWYGDITRPDPIGDLRRYLEGYWEKYRLPIWLTEYSGADFKYHLRKTTQEDNARFARESIELLETLPFVERYAWYAPLVSRRDRNYSKVGLCRWDGAFTPVGLAWRAAPAKPASVLSVQPVCGVTGYEVSIEYIFGTEGNVRNIADLERLFTYDATWGRINEELQAFKPFNTRNHVFERDCLALTGRHDGSDNYTEYDHITSGAIISKATFMAPCIVEFVAKLPAGRGVWPSLWLYDYHSGRHDSSEIDVMESQNNPPRDDRSKIYQIDHGPGVGAILSNPGHFSEWGFWQPYGELPGGDLSAKYAAYSVHWERDRTTRYVDDKEGITRAFRWTGPEPPNIIAYNSIGSSKLDWPGPVLRETFSGDNATFRLKSIRVFTPRSSNSPRPVTPSGK